MEGNLMPVIMLSGIFGLLGLIFLIVGLAISSNRKKKEKMCTARTYGVVTDIKKRRMPRRVGEPYPVPLLYPVFQYTIGNQTMEKLSNFGASTCKYKIGQEVEICYNPENYEQYYVVGEGVSANIGKIFTIVGMFWIIVTIVLAIILL